MRCKSPLQKDAMKIGYARVSTEEQSLDLQIDALRAAGCTQIFEDKGVTGSARKRPGLDEALQALSEGDTLVTWRLDRLGRSLPHLIEVVSSLKRKGCGFQSLTEAIDTETAGGRLVFHLMGALAEFERSLIIERTKAGQAAAKARGQRIGRPRKLTRRQVAHAKRLIQEGTESVSSMAKVFGCNKSTLSRALK